MVDKPSFEFFFWNICTLNNKIKIKNKKIKIKAISSLSGEKFLETCNTMFKKVLKPLIRFYITQF